MLLALSASCNTLSGAPTPALSSRQSWDRPKRVLFAAHFSSQRSVHQRKAWNATTFRGH